MTTTELLRTEYPGIGWRCPLALVCASLGVPRKDWRLFSRWAHDSSSPKALDELFAYLDVMVAERCHRPANDLLSQLIQVEVDGAELTMDDIRMLVTALVAGADKS
jgi:cytochrome P450